MLDNDIQLVMLFVVDLTLCSLTSNLPAHASCVSEGYEAAGTKVRNDKL